jgi:hypothetical protein
MRVQFIKSDTLFQQQKNALGMQDVELACNPFLMPCNVLRSFIKNEIWYFEQSCANARSEEQLGNDLAQLNKRQLTNLVLMHRVNNCTFLGFKFVHRVKVCEASPFEIQFSSARLGFMKMTVSFSVSKSRVVHTSNQVPNVVEVCIY